MDWTTLIITIFTTLCGGGIGALATLSSTRRKAEFEVWEKQLDEMKELLQAETERNRELVGLNKEKEDRFIEQTKRLRETQDREFALMKKACDLEIELANVRCNDHECPFRRPPNALTPPPPGVSRDEFHTKKKRATKSKKPDQVN